MPIDLKGKKYKLVAERLAWFWEHCADYRINTDLEVGQHHAFVRALILDENHKVMSTGHALCNINEDKAVEKCETVAVGRCLAFLGYPELMGTEIASADEIGDFHLGKAKKEVEGQYKNYGFALQRNLKSCYAIQEFLDNGELGAAWEAWLEIDEESRKALRVASTKGGWLTVEQAKRLGEASAQDFNPERGVYASIADKGVGNV